MSKQAVIIILGGALRKTKNSWSSTTFTEGDNFGVSGDYLRPKAAAILYNKFLTEGRDIAVIASGGKGQYSGNPDMPTLSQVLKREMVKEGIPGEAIIEENLSNNTFQQLQESAKVLNNKEVESVVIITNKHQLPRVRAFIEVNKDLNRSYRNLKLISAEEILIKDDPKSWSDLIKQAYASSAIKERVALEKAGEKQIRNGTYHYKTNYSGKIKTAIVGLGRISSTYDEDTAVAARMDFPTHFSVLRGHPKFQLVAAQDRSPAARKLFSAKLNRFGVGAAVYKDWRKMIKELRPDLLVVATNTESHIEICDYAIDQGVKNILCEKPIGYSVKEAELLVKKADKNKCNIFVNYLRAFNPSYRSLFSKIKDGAFGRVQSFDAKYSKGIFNNGTHMIDLLIRTFGEAKKVQGFKNPTRDVSEIDPTVSALLTFKNGVNGYMHGLNADFYGVFDLEIMAEKGRIKIMKDENEDKLVDIKSGLYPVYDNIYLGNNYCSGKDSLQSLKLAEVIVSATGRK